MNTKVLSSLFWTCLFLFCSPLWAQSPLLDSLNPNADGAVHALAVQADGRILVGGSFSTLGGQPRKNLGRLNPDGSLDPAFNPGAEGSVYALLVQDDGRILVGGAFTTLGGLGRDNLGRLNADGTIDDTFDPRAGDGSFGRVNALAVQADGKILVGGAFETLAGQSRSNLGRLNVNGTVDTTFVNLGFLMGDVSTLALQPNGQILIGGEFTILVPDADGDQIAYFNLVRLGSNGKVDANFYPDPNGSVTSMIVQPDGNILLAGGFTILDRGNSRVPRPGLGRISSNSKVDSTFNPSIDGEVNTMVLQTDRKILLGGTFKNLGGQPRNRIGRLLSNGTIDTAFNPEVDGTVRSLAVQADGKTLVGGDFRAISGESRNKIGRLNATPAATQTLSLAGSTITWLRGETSPEIGQATFHYTTDGVKWTSKPGARIAGGWRITGIALPTGTAIRARGFVTGGSRNGSGWFVESYYGKPAFLTPPVSRTNNFGTTVTFNAVPVSSGILSYQWLKNGNILRDQGNVSGSATVSLQLNQVSKLDEGDYRLVLSNSFGSVTSGVARLAVRDPYIITHPASASRNVGQIVRFSVTASGSPTLAYQWYHNGAMVPGAVAASLTLPAVSLAQAGNYTVVVRNSQGSTTSATASLTVNVVQLDHGFDPRTDRDVGTIAVQADGKILVGGSFTALGGVPRSRIGRLNADGTLDEGFDPDANSDVYSVALQTDGKILIGGRFTTLGGKSRNRIGRLNSDGTLDAAFNSSAGSDVYSVKVQADGKILVSGRFTTLGGQPRGYIGRLNPDGTLDGSFNPGSDNDVMSMSLQADGKIVVGGEFTSLGGKPRNFIGRLNANGTLDTTFTTAANWGVYTTAVQADGKILVGGAFDTLAGQPRSGIGRLNSNGGLDVGFNPGADGQVFCISPLGDGRIVVGGSFTSLAGQLRLRLGRLKGDGTLEGSFSPGADNAIFTLAVQPDGKILAGGSFKEFGGQNRRGIARLNTTEPATQSLNFSGSTLTWLRSGPGPEVWWTFFESSIDGKQWSNLGLGTRVGGGWQKTGITIPRNATLRVRGHVAGDQYGSGWFAEGYFGTLQILSQPASLTSDFDTSASFTVMAGGTGPLSYQWQKDGVALATQGQISGATNATLRLSRVTQADEGNYRVIVSNSVGSVTSLVATLTVKPDLLESTFVPLADSSVFALTVQPDNKIMLGGFFDNPSSSLARFHGDGNLDGTFNSGATGGLSPRVEALVVQPDGKVLVGGEFASLGGFPVSNLGRIHANGAVDETFQPSINGRVSRLAVQEDGKILLSGSFNTLNGQSRFNIGRLNPDGTLDTAFDMGPTTAVYAMAVQADGKVLVGGSFDTLGGQPRRNIGRLHAAGSIDDSFNPQGFSSVDSLAVQADGKILVVTGNPLLSRIGRLNADGTLDNYFNPEVDGSVHSLVIQANGKVLVGGQFTTLGGRSHLGLGRLNADGTLDNTFSPNVKGIVYGLALQSDGRLLVGGLYSFLSAKSRSNIGRLLNTEVATQSLNYDGSTITWMRGGASPEVWRTTFESSTDGLMWTDLGTGVRVSGGWQLTAVSFPPHASLRARGYVSGGYRNGSGWFVETLLFPNPAIQLSVVRDGSTVNLIWTGGTGPFQIQRTTDLSPQPIPWQDMGAPVSGNSVTLPLGPGNGFWRVRQL